MSRLNGKQIQEVISETAVWLPRIDRQKLKGGTSKD